MKINIKQVKQMLENQEIFIKDHPKLIEKYKRFTVDEVQAELCKLIRDDLPKIATEFKETEIIKLDENIYSVKHTGFDCLEYTKRFISAHQRKGEN